MIMKVFKNYRMQNMFIIWPSILRPVGKLVGKWSMVRCVSKWSMVLIKPYFKITYLSLHIPKERLLWHCFCLFHLMISWVYRKNIFSHNSLVWKLCLSAKFPPHEIRWNHGIFYCVCYFNNEYNNAKVIDVLKPNNCNNIDQRIITIAWLSA